MSPDIRLHYETAEAAEAAERARALVTARFLDAKCEDGTFNLVLGQIMAEVQDDESRAYLLAAMAGLASVFFRRLVNDRNEDVPEDLQEDPNELLAMTMEALNEYGYTF